jgi:hypothetical protein
MLTKHNPLVLGKRSDGFPLISSSSSTTIYYSAESAPGLIIAVNTFADDIKRVSGTRPKVHSSDTPIDSSKPAVFIGTVGSRLIQGVRQDIRGGEDRVNEHETAWKGLEGKWEAYDIRGIPGKDGCGDRLYITGSDMVSCSTRAIMLIYREELYTLCTPFHHI